MQRLTLTKNSTSIMDIVVTRPLSKEDENEEEYDYQEYDEEDEEEEDYKGLLDDEISSEDLRESEIESTSVLIEVGLYRPILKTRRTVAEILHYNLNYVQSLHEMSLKAIAASFHSDPIELSFLTKEEQNYIIQHLSPNLPLTIVAGRIEAEGYWKNRSEHYFGAEAFKEVDMSEHGNSYRRLFFESYLQDRIANFIPLTHDFDKLAEDVSLGGEFVERLILDQLMIPVLKQGLGEQQVTFDEQGKKTELDYNHLNLELLGEYFTNLKELNIKYGVNNCGLNFDWSMFHCTNKDCSNLCGMMKKTPELRSLIICHSRIDDIKTSILTTELVNCSLTKLCLAHNSIADDGARLLGKYLKDDKFLSFLDLSDNKIHSEGGMALAQGLKYNNTLKKLKLRLNLIGQGAIRLFCIALRYNFTLDILNLSANIIDDECCATIGRDMKLFLGISNINLSSNSRITIDGIKFLLKGLQLNESLTKLKLKGLPSEPDYNICFTEKLNLNHSRKLPVDRSFINVSA